MTIEDFESKINNLPEHFENRNFEEYLLALYKIVLEQQDTDISLELVFMILEKALTSEPYPFNSDWLEIVNPPRQNGMSRKMTNPEFKDSISKNTPSELEGVPFTLEVLKFQIVELHKMKDKQLKDKYRYFGIDSETGNRWYNFTPFDNLSCGIRCMSDNELGDEIDWSFIGHLLEDGRIYE